LTVQIGRESFIGKSLPRVDALDKVTGRAVYGDDIKMTGLLYGKILRSTRAHARIKRIDVSKAKALEGVKAVVTGRDAPFRGGEALRDQPFLAIDKVRFIGEPVAAVAAVDEKIAEEAIKLIEVEYEDLPAVFDVFEALKPGAPLIHEELHTYEHIPIVSPVPGTNICAKFEFERGDIEKGFADADVVIEDTFTFAPSHHGQIEPFMAIAQVDYNGRITVWVPNDAPSRLRKDLSDAMKIPQDRIRVISPPYMGGGFGGKGGLKVEMVCIALAMHTECRPVKIRLTREETFEATLTRHGAVCWVKMGAKKDGRIIACHSKLFYNTGAYAEKGPTVTLHGCESGVGPYDIPNIKVEGYCVYTNRPIAGALRGYGLPQSSWAHESLIDMLSHKLGMDPLEVRLKNALVEGSINPIRGDRLFSVGLKECLEKAAKEIEWGKKRPPNRGVGIACEYKATKTPSGSTAFVRIEQDGSVEVVTSSVEIGQGVRTILTQIVAEELGASPNLIKVTVPDTDYTPFDASTTASRTTFHMGNAVREAARDAKRQLLELASKLFNLSPDQLDTWDNKVFPKGGGKEMTFREVITSHYGAGLSILGRGSYYPNIPGTLFSGHSVFYMYAAHAVEIEVDVETGIITILKYVAAHDVGRAINPKACEGQIEGGVLQGIGSTLYEEIIYDDKGKMLNPNFRDYKMPTAMDMPKIIPIIVEAPHKEGPFGAKGIGEITLVPVAPAIANALFNATGVKIKELPLTAEKVYFAIKKQKEGVR